ncbi:MAG: NAD-dependent epimerase/dehydratase family protein [Clostridiales bacterium]|jgi:UDP-glucose 4-epimerase|nr:NAD-dependent epimerase/dehydratase family protein [Clostridiales bacterium]
MGKKIILTGKTGYIAKALAGWLNARGLQTELVSLRAGVPEGLEADVIVHAAALVHKDEREFSEQDYMRVNCALTEELARRCTVRQFIFLSTMAVYGLEGKVGKPLIVDRTTPVNPRTFYGKSKLAAEQALRAALPPETKLAVIRPPMVYGPDCPGNYARLKKLAAWLPVFPYVDNSRSVLHINNLCALILAIIQDQAEGMFFPQDSEPCNTSLLFKKLAQEQGRKVLMPRLPAPLFRVPLSAANKLFGNLVYDKNISSFY